MNNLLANSLLTISPSTILWVRLGFGVLVSFRKVKMLENTLDLSIVLMSGGELKMLPHLLQNYNCFDLKINKIKTWIVNGFSTSLFGGLCFLLIILTSFFLLLIQFEIFSGGFDFVLNLFLVSWVIVNRVCLRMVFIENNVARLMKLGRCC